MSSPLTLSLAKPDFESLVLQLQLYLAAKGTWSDLLTSSTGETLIEMMGAVGAFNQFAIESAAREDFLETAVRDSSIYAIADMLGVRITRKSPASTGVILTRESNVGILTMPRFSVFTVDGELFFNRESITFNSGATESNPSVLYEGTMRTQSISASASTFNKIYLNELGFGVSDADVDVYLVNTSTGERELWNQTTDGIWIAGPFDKVYYDSTTGDGDTALAFGDGNHGKLPTIGYTLEIDYAVTKGSEGNNGQAGLKIEYPTDPTIKGFTTSTVAGGADQKSASYYSALAPYIYRARKRAVNPSDYKAIATDYPSVASVTIKSQRDIAPGDLRWMNVVRICVLPKETDVYTTVEWDDFLSWFSDKKHAAVHIQTYNPTKVVVNIHVTLALSPSAVSADIIPTVTSAITALFEKSTTTLGRRLAISDITQVCKIAGVDYVDMVTPLADQVATDDYTYFSLGTLQVSTNYTERNSI